MLVELAQLHEAISAVQALDLDALSPLQRHALTVGLFTESNRLSAARSRAVECWEHTATWATDGALSPSHRLANATRSSFATARAEVSRARQRRRMPGAHAALAEGRIGLDHLRLLGEANRPSRAEAYRRDEQTLVGFCAALPFLDAKQAIDYWCQRVDADGVEDDAADLADQNRLHVSQSWNDRWFLDGALDPVAGAIVANELDRLAEQLRLQDKQAGIRRTPAQRRAGALVLMAERSAARPTDAKAAQVLLHVYVGEDSLARLCELGNGTVLRPGQLLAYLDRAAFETLLFDGPTTVVSVSTARTFTGTVRKAVAARDRRCQHPSGCNIPAERCDVDHILPSSEGGPTSQFNGRISCHGHNRIAKLRHAGTPLPHRDITRLDEAICRIRWRTLHPDPDDDTWLTLRLAASELLSHPPHTRARRRARRPGDDQPKPDC